MISRSTVKGENNGLFSPQIPMKKSIVISDDPFFLDLSASTRTLRASHIRRASNIQKKESKESKESRVYVSGINYPASTFIAKKLKRIIHSSLRSVFRKIKSHKKIILNFNLLNSISKRFVSSAFFSMKYFSQTHKGQKLGQVIVRNKRPHLLFQAVIRVVKKQQKIVMQTLVKKCQKIKFMCNFLLIVERIIKSDIKTYFKKKLIKNIKILTAQSCLRDNSVRKIFALIPKIEWRQKKMVLKKIIDSLKVGQLQNISSAKKNVAIKLNETSVQRARTLMTQRQKLRGIKNDLQTFSADKNKTRYQIRRDLNAYRNKLKEQEKKANKTIYQLTSEVQNLQADLSETRLKNVKRIARIQSKIGQQQVKQLYKLINSQQTNSLGEIKWRSLSKDKVATLRIRGKELDEFHAFQNQRLRQQIGGYENNPVFKNLWADQLIIQQQNQNLKAMMQNIIFRSLDNSIYLEVLRDSLQ